MNTAAILMMILALALVWGGLVASILFLRSRPETAGAEDPDLVGQDDVRAARPHPTRDT